MSQPVWLTDAGSLGVIPEGIFYQVSVLAYDPADPDNPNAVYYKMIAGSLPPGVQCTKTGLIEGVPHAISSLQGVPLEVSRDVTSTFAVRAFTERVVNGVEVIDRICDRTFSLTVTGQDVPQFLTPAGLIGTYYDGTEIAIQIEFTDQDPGDNVSVSLVSGALPPGVFVDRKGLIAGAITPLVGPPGTATAGYDDTPKDEYPNDFTTRSTSKNFQFTLAITDGKDSNLRTFEIFVYSKDSMSADTTDFTADNTWITADIVPTRTPILLNPPGDLGRVRADNYYFYQFHSIDFDGDAVEYDLTVGAGVGYDADGTTFSEDDIGYDRGTFSLPPGLSIDSDTGWFYGYIPDQGATEYTYRFAIRVRKRDRPDIVSEFYYFTITIIGNLETEVIWLNGPDLGTIDNGSTSTLEVLAENLGGRSLEYRLVSGSYSRLPQGLTLLPSGHIVGKVSFNTFALDGGTTTFDVNRDTRLDPNPTTFDLKFEFDVNAFAPQTGQLGYSVAGITVLNGGSGYVSQPTVTISAPPDSQIAEQATAGLVTIEGGVITAINIGNPGRGYRSPPIITITGGGGAAATAFARLSESELTNPVSVIRRFSITVNRAFDEPYEGLYIKCMPPYNDRTLIETIVQDQNVFAEDLLYRPDDPNFGVAKNVIYQHAYGLTPASLELYVQSLQLNHYWRDITLGEIRTAQALDANGNVLYEVVYSLVIDNLTNNQGQSVSKSITLPYPVVLEDGTITTVYPNSLDNMRNQVIDTVGQTTPGLPLWMISKQANGSVLGFVPAWVIAYVKPGQGKRVAYNFQQKFANQLNNIDFTVDRYELDRSMTHLWSTETDNWVPNPAQATTFDQSTTIFDGGSVTFIAPADRITGDDRYDKYLVFPKRTILG
jgi:hypothetical protein